MKSLTTILIIFVTCMPLYAQVIPLQRDSLDQLRKRVTPPSTDVRPMDVLLNSLTKATTVNVADTIPKHIAKARNVVDSLHVVTAKLKDSLQLKTASSYPQRMIDRLSQNTDSLKITDTSAITQSVKHDSITSALSQFQNLPIPGTEKINALTDASQASELNRKISSIQSKVGEKLQVPENKIELSSHPAKTPTVDSEIPKVNIAEQLPTMSLANPNVPALPDLQNEYRDVPIPTQEQIKAPKRNLNSGKLDRKLSDLPGKEKLETINNKAKLPLGKLEEGQAVAKELREDDLNSIEKNTQSQVTERFAGDEKIAALKEQEALIAEQKAKLESVKNQEVYRKQTRERARQMVMKQMAASQTQLQDAVAQVTKYQSSVGTLPLKKSDLPPKRDPIQKLRKVERLIPGVTFKVQHSSDLWLIDVNPSLRYRITSYWSVGTGWNERISFGDDKFPREQVRLFGTRTFTEVTILKGFSVRLEGESLNALVKQDPIKQDASRRTWIYNYNAGIKKDFSVFKRVLGNAQFMYSVYKTHSFNAYPNRFNMRFGFEYIPKQKKRK